MQCAEFIPLPLSRHARPPGVLAAAHDRHDQRAAFRRCGRHAFRGSDGRSRAFDRALAQTRRRPARRCHVDSSLIGARSRQSHARGSRTPDGDVEMRATACWSPRTARIRRWRALLGLPPLADGQHPAIHGAAAAAVCDDTDIWLSHDYPGGYAWLFPKGRSRESRARHGSAYRIRHENAARCAAPRSSSPEGRVGAARSLCRTGGAIPVGGLRERLAVGDNICSSATRRGSRIRSPAPALPPPWQAASAAADAARAALLPARRRALADYEADIRDQFGESLARAVSPPRELARVVAYAAAARRCRAPPRLDRVREYYRASVTA